MTVEEFSATLASATPPLVSAALQALWHDARGDWDIAHQTADDAGGTDGAWVHAYLHRKEGQSGNAAYWYNLAGQPAATDSLDAEWARIVSALL
jgi:hypothetical protein